MPHSALDDDELMEIVLPGIRADFEAYETYAYRPDHPLECPITAMGARGDAHVAPEDLAAWRSHAKQSFSIRLFDGDHFYLHGNRASLTRALREELGTYLSSVN
jgi:surfactin synthase thioesterase subunit